MAIRTIYPSKTTTLYQNSGSMNAGLDPIIELVKEVSASGGDNTMNSRMLLQFDTSAVSASLSALGRTTASSAGNLKWCLKVFISEEIDIPLQYNISAHGVRESWDMGTGQRYHSPVTTEGAGWTYRDSSDVGTSWTSDNPGGYYYSSSYGVASQSFNNVQGDINLDVTDLVEYWHNGTITNNGILIRRSGSQESGTTQFGITRYYSKNTHTIYPPRLEAQWDDGTSYTASGMTALTANDDIKVSALLLPSYKQDTEARVEILAQPRFPSRSQTGAVSAATRYALPASSSYAIIDNATGETVIEHNTTASLVACTSSKHYIDINFTGLFPERYYGLQVKVPNLLFTNSVQYFNIPTLFKVVK